MKDKVRIFCLGGIVIEGLFGQSLRIMGLRRVRDNPCFTALRPAAP